MNRFVRAFLGVLPMFLLLAGALRAEAAEAKPLVKTFDNGLTAAIIENHETPVVALRVYIRTGSMYEGEYLGAGMSHFLEHLVSGGTTTTRPEAESRRLLDSIGAQTNAYTTRDHTCYHITTSSRFFDIGLDLLSDWMMNCTITEEEFKREFEVVQREMESGRTNPRRALSELMGATMFTVHPVRHPVIGYREVFRKLTRDDIYNYYRRMYTPDNVLVAVGGDVGPQEALEKIRVAFAKFERRRRPTIDLPEEPRQLGPREAVRELDASQAYLRMGFRTIPLSHPDLYPLDLISFILSQGRSSRLVRKLRDEKRLVFSIASWSYTPGFDAGEFIVNAMLAPGKIPEARKAILAELMRFRDEGVSEQELKRAKRQKISEHVFGLQTVEAQAANLALDILSARDPEFSNSYVARIQATTAEEIREAARKYFSEDRLCVAVVRPRTAKPAVKETPDAAQADAGSVERIVLDNGMRVLVKRNPSQPIVSVQAFFLAGVRVEPDGMSGLSAFTAQLMPRGTKERTAAEIAGAFDDMGGSISGASGNNSLYVSAACLSEDLPGALAIVADVIRNPAFDEKQVERLRPQLVARRQRQKDNWRATLSEHFRSNFFKTHPYRNSSLGSGENLKKIRAADLARFHHTHCVPNNMVLAVFGDIDPARVRELVQKHFADWPKDPGFEAAALPPEPRPTEDKTLDIESAHKLGGVFIGFPGITLRDTKDRYAMDVLDAVVSGIHLPRGWLHEKLRGKGLVYEVHAYGFTGLEPGFFGVYAGCEPGRVEEVKKIILRQIGRLHDEKIPEEELESARRICITADVLDQQTSAEQAMAAALDELYGLGFDAGERYEDGILAVTEAEVKRVAAKYLDHHLCVIMRPKDAGPPAKPAP